MVHDHAGREEIQDGPPSFWLQGIGCQSQEPPLLPVQPQLDRLLVPGCLHGLLCAVLQHLKLARPACLLDVLQNHGDPLVPRITAQDLAGQPLRLVVAVLGPCLLHVEIAGEALDEQGL